MSSLCSLGLAPQWRPKSTRFLFLFHSKRRTSAFVPRVTSSSSIDDDAVSGPKAKQVQYLTTLLFFFFLKIAAAFCLIGSGVVIVMAVGLRSFRGLFRA